MFSFRFWINHPARCRYDSNENNFEDAVNDLIESVPKLFFGCKVSAIEKIFNNGKRLGKKYLMYAENKINS